MIAREARVISLQHWAFEAYVHTYGEHGIGVGKIRDCRSSESGNPLRGMRCSVTDAIPIRAAESGSGRARANVFC